MTDETQETHEETSLSEDISAAFDGITEETPQETSEEVTETPAETQEEITEEPEPLTAPEHWPEDTRTMFDSLPREAQQWAIDRDKAMDEMIREKTEGLADFQKEYAPISKLFEPYKNDMIIAGTNPAQIVQRWMAIEQSLREKPIDTIRDVMRLYGVTTEALAPQDDDADPDIKALRTEINELRTQSQQRLQTEQTNSMQALQNQVEKFANEKGEDGQPLHPYFNDVISDMVAMAQAEKSQGQQPDINTLYERAVWANPETRAQLQAAQQKAAAKEAQAEAQRKAKAAQAAAASVSGAPSGTQDESDLSLRETIEKAYH